MYQIQQRLEVLYAIWFNSGILSNPWCCDRISIVELKDMTNQY